MFFLDVDARTALAQRLALLDWGVVMGFSLV